MIDRLYVARGDKTSGPFSAAQLRGLATAGRLRPTDTVWREGAIEKAVDAAKVKNLFPSPQTLAQAEGAGAQAACETPPPRADGSRPLASAPQVPLDSPDPPFNPPGNPAEIDPAPAPVPIASVPPASPALLGAGDPTSQGQTAPKEKALRPPPEPVRKRRAVAVKGAVILSQDGATVHYRKKCTQCGFEDRCRSSMPIGNGTSRIQFYCPECRKGREVQLLAIMQ